MVFQLHVTSVCWNECFCVSLSVYNMCKHTLKPVYVCTLRYWFNSNQIIFKLALLTFYGIWNLDFFCYFLPSFCISSDMSTLARFRRRWNPKGSVINTFATFLLLSYSKLLTVSYSLLDANILYNNSGERVGPVVFYHDASIEFFSRQHLPFTLPAMCILLVFVVFPLLLLLLYPMRSFQRCLGYCTRISNKLLKWYRGKFPKWLSTTDWCK